MKIEFKELSHRTVKEEASRLVRECRACACQSSSTGAVVASSRSPVEKQGAGSNYGSHNKKGNPQYKI